ncbi:hypothetical protein HMPREF9711_00183 [Myroides odoratimimus CCUG 3837]|uniref:GIY-YIG nuclease family protein n=1 Tax=Myroides odoratimimus TaxID=76832 RepID=UPI000280AA18|nr:GIY-YIG nuclease family protein [Myroides odoratimimus]EKB06873.1 hypothetical protein HMPREF9711_00183 [Myroides odoratimimus CCUG 3837]
MRINFTEQNHQEIANLLDSVVNESDATLTLEKNILYGIVPRFLYLLKAKDSSFYKTGITNDLEKRKRELQTGCPLELHYIFAVEADLIDYYGKEIIYLERFLHQNYKECKVLGEWYKLSNIDVCKVYLFLTSPIYARDLCPVAYINYELEGVLISCSI